MKKNLAKILAIIVTISTIATVSACSSKTNTENPITESTTERTTQKTNPSADTTKTEIYTENKTSTEPETTTSNTTTRAPAGNNSITVNQALNKLEKRYGSEYEINGSISEGEFYYFSIIKDNDKYASVKVNLSNSKAYETISETGKTSTFTLK